MVVKIKKELYEKEKEKIFSDIMEIAWHRTVVKDLRYEDLEFLKDYKGKPEYFDKLLEIIETWIDSFDNDRDYASVAMFNWAVKKYIREVTRGTNATRDIAEKRILNKIKNYKELLEV